MAFSEDIVAFYGRVPRGTMKAVVILMDGDVKAVIGVVREGQIGKFFSDIREDLVPYLRKIAVLRAIKLAMSIVQSFRGPVWSEAEHSEGRKLLIRLGFTHVDGGSFLWPI